MIRCLLSYRALVRNIALGFALATSLGVIAAVPASATRSVSQNRPGSEVRRTRSSISS
jgi:hypothetical protein